MGVVATEPAAIVDVEIIELSCAGSSRPGGGPIGLEKPPVTITPSRSVEAVSFIATVVAGTPSPLPPLKSHRDATKRTKKMKRQRHREGNTCVRSKQSTGGKIN